MGTLHCALENGADLYVNERQKIQHYRTTGLLKKEECQISIFLKMFFVLVPVLFCN